MLIEKRFQFKNQHIVRNCSSERCRFSHHAHTYQVFIELTSDKLDNGGMIEDFGLLKGTIKTFISMFDNSWTVWNKEPVEYKDYVTRMTDRIIFTPHSPSAEFFSILFFKVIQQILDQTVWNNGEGNVKLNRVKVYETLSGCAKCYQQDLQLLPFEISDLLFTPEIVKDSKVFNVFDKLVRKQQFVNPVIEQQIQL